MVPFDAEDEEGNKPTENWSIVKNENESDRARNPTHELSK